MDASILRGTAADDLAAGLVHDQRLQLTADLGHLLGDVLAKSIVVTEFLRQNAFNEILGLLDKVVQFSIGINVEVLELVEEVPEVGDRRVSKDSLFTGDIVGQSLREMRD